jgi:hypothetical protein
MSALGNWKSYKVKLRRSAEVGSLATYLLAAIGATGLTYFIDLAFDTDLLSALGQAALVAFACALMVAVWKATSDDGPRDRG